MSDVSTTDAAEQASVAEEPVTVAPVEPAREDLVPAWLAALVLVLLLGIMGVGGWIIRDRIGGGATSSPGAAQSIRQLAIQRAKDEVSAKPNDPQAHLDLGFAYQQDAQYRTALSEYDRVLQIDKRNTAALYNKGVIYQALGDRTSAEKLLLQVLDISKTHALAAKTLGEYYKTRNDPAALIRAVAPAAQARPDMADLQYLLGWAYEQKGDRTTAEQYYRAALKYVPDMPEARDGLARVSGAK